jgi:hypothetical protein
MSPTGDKSNISVRGVVERLDGLDGVRDGIYKSSYGKVELYDTNPHALVGHPTINVTGQCLGAEKTQSEKCRKKEAVCTYQAGLAAVGPNGRGAGYNFQDCLLFASRLDTIIDIMERLPLYRSVRKSSQDAINPVNILEETYTYLLVDSMLYAYGQGIITNDIDFPKLFEKVHYNTLLVDSMRLIFEDEDINVDNLHFENVSIAFGFFSNVLKRLGVDASPFQPTSNPEPSPAVSPQPTIENPTPKTP